MSIIENIIVIGKALLALRNNVATICANSNPISISNLRFGMLLPRRTLLTKQIKNDINLLDYETFNECYREKAEDKIRWVNSCELNFRIANLHPKKKISIIGIYFNFHKLNFKNVASYLEVPQGDNGINEAVHFACCFMNGRFSRQLYKIENYRIVLQGDFDFFDTSTIDIDPASSLNINLSLISNIESIEICSIDLIYCLENKGVLQAKRSARLPLKNPITIFALNDVPADKRYKSTWDPNPPIISLESDGLTLSSREVKCRWDDFPCVN